MNEKDLTTVRQIYNKGGHGFRMSKQNLPADSWIKRFGDWIKNEIEIK